MKPLIVEGKTLLVGDKFYFNFEGNKSFPNDPKGWIQCSFSGADSGGVIVKPKGFEKFVISRNNNERFSMRVIGGEKHD